MAQVQDEKGLCSGYLRSERTPSCETLKKRESGREQDTKIVSKLPAKQRADLHLPLTFSFYLPLPWPDANQF